ncbi:MAG: twin-arginine translocase TatA/TatE family subunit [Bacteroidota bacterium]
MGLGIQEILLILVLVLIFFGADKIPQLARSLGKGMSEFRRAQQEFQDELAAAGSESVPAGQTPASAEHDPSEAQRTGREDGEASQVICPGCQGRTVRGSLYCSQCGQRLTPEVICGLCHRRLQLEERFCPNCGQARPG